MKRNFTTHSDLKVQFKDAERHLKPWSGYVIQIFRNRTPTVNQTFVIESRIPTSSCLSVRAQKLHLSIISFQVTPFKAQCFQRFAL